jgi:prevent-host-death family protein
MKTVAVYEAKTRLSEILTAVEQGEQVTITRHGHPIARMIALNVSETQLAEKTAVGLDRTDLIARIKATRRGCSLEGIDIRNAIEEGRD